MRKSFLKMTAIGLSFVVMSWTAVAQTYLPAPASIDPKTLEEVVAFQVHSSKEVANDMMRSTLWLEEAGEDAASLFVKVTGVLNTATEKVREVSGVKLTTGTRASYPVYGQHQRISEWRERTELHLESKEFSALAQLVAALIQDSKGALKLKSQQFFTSPERRREVEARLTQEVLVKFRERAELIAKSMGAGTYWLVNMALDSSSAGSYVVPQARMMAMSASAKAAPAQQIEAGTSELAMTASGKIRLEPSAPEHLRGVNGYVRGSSKSVQKSRR